MVFEHGIPADGHGHAASSAPSWQITVVDETGSTNTDLMNAAAGGAPDRSVLVAKHQRAGRGRLGRSWDAPPGSNLLVSLLFREVPAVPVELTHRVGLAACLVARDLIGPDVWLKWPNDVLIGRNKLAGILAQLAPDGAYAVVGLGMNIRWHPFGGARLGAQFDPGDVLARILRRVDELPADVGELYRSHLATLGRRVRAIMAAETIEGVAADVDASGRLVIRAGDGSERVVDTADVIHLR